MAGRAEPLRAVRWLTIGTELVIVWSDSTESYLPLDRLRDACPCAQCAGEPDLLGRLARGPALPKSPDSRLLLRVDPVGGYALQLHWGDGHSTGLYPFPLLRSLGEAG